MRVIVFVGIALSAACIPLTATNTPAAMKLGSYETVTPSSTATQPTGLIELAENVLPSPTPFTYTVKSGDTLGQIAEKFNVDLDALLLANPGTNPNGMHIGETLRIPSNQRNTSGEFTPTPAPFSVQQISCHATAEGGLWCFVLAHNDSPDPMENVTAQVTLMDAHGQPAGSQVALLPLDILPPNQSLPLAAFFMPGIPSEVRPQTQILTAIRLPGNDQRYLPATVQNTSVQVDWTGLSAEVRGQITLPATSRPAARIWVAAVLYDASGDVTGVRRWEASGGLQAGDSLPFSFIVSSIAGEIGRVEFAVEARP